MTIVCQQNWNIVAHRYSSPQHKHFQKMVFFTTTIINSLIWANISRLFGETKHLKRGGDGFEFGVVSWNLTIKCALFFLQCVPASMKSVSRPEGNKFRFLTTLYDGP